jgi:hypothetical protein
MVGEDIAVVFPGIVSRGISFPLDKVLEATITSVMTVIDDGLDFILSLAINHIRRGSWEVRPVLFRLLIRG